MAAAWMWALLRGAEQLPPPDVLIQPDSRMRITGFGVLRTNYDVSRWLYLEVLVPVVSAPAWRLSAALASD